MSGDHAGDLAEMSVHVGRKLDGLIRALDQRQHGAPDVLAELAHVGERQVGAVAGGHQTQPLGADRPANRLDVVSTHVRVEVGEVDALSPPVGGTRARLFSVHLDEIVVARRRSRGQRRLVGAIEHRPRAPGSALVVGVDISVITHRVEQGHPLRMDPPGPRAACKVKNGIAVAVASCGKPRHGQRHRRRAGLIVVFRNRQEAQLAVDDVAALGLERRGSKLDRVRWILRAARSGKARGEECGGGHGRCAHAGSLYFPIGGAFRVGYRPGAARFRYICSHKRQM